MPGITTTRYVIRTTEGTKGPFSPAEIGRLVQDGRLAPTTRILDVNARRAVTAAEAMTSASTEATRPIDFEVIRKAAIAAQQGRTDDADLNIPSTISSEETETLRRADAPKRMEQGRRKSTEDSLEATDAQPVGESGHAPAALVRNGALQAPARRPAAPPTEPAPSDAAGTPVPTPDPGRAETAPQAKRGTGPMARATTTARRGRETSPPRAALRRGGARRKGGSRSARLIIVLAAVGLLLATAAIALLSYAHRDSYPDQAAKLLEYANAHLDSVDATEGDGGLARILIKRDHQEALDAARIKRGYFEGYKPAYDQERYLGALRDAIARQVASGDSEFLSGLSRELTASADPTLSDIKVAKRLAQKAVDIDHEKSWRSLDALAWATFRSGDAAKAALIEDQASEVASDGATKAECASQASMFKGAH